MNLSDAILKGCEMRPDKTRCTLWALVFEDSTKRDFYRMRPASCVLGAAYDGTFGPVQLQYDPQYQILKINGKTDTGMAMAQLREVYPILCEIAFPESEKDTRPLECVITSFNDELKDGHHDLWTREQIAAWIKYVVEGAPMIPED